MAVSAYYSPLPTEIDDPVTYKQASELLARTGHSAAAETIRRWVSQEGVETVRVRGKVYVSWTDVVEVHFRRTAAKLRAGSNWP